jgi:hypothetical protein
LVGVQRCGDLSDACSAEKNIMTWQLPITAFSLQCVCD